MIINNYYCFQGNIYETKEEITEKFKDISDKLISEIETDKPFNEFVELYKMYRNEGESENSSIVKSILYKQDNP